jgi:hypothetical protein
MLQGAWLAMEAHHVIALRLMKLAMGGSAATQEAHLMVAEKVDAATRAAGMVAAAVARGTSDGGADAVVRMLRQEVQANRTRLGSA